MKHLQRILIMLCLIVAGVQSAQADYIINREWLNKHADVVNVSVGGVTYEVCHIYWMVGYVDQQEIISATEDRGYKERYITADDWHLTIWQSDYQSETNNAYYASVVGITGSGAITIPDSITHEGRNYPVKYVGLHTVQTIVEKDTTYFQKAILGAGSYQTTTCKYYGYSKTNVSVTASNATNMTVNVDVEFLGNFNSTSLTTLNFQKKANIASTLNVPSLSNLNLEGEMEIRGTISSNSLTNIYFNKLTCKGKFDCPSLQNVYFTNNSVSFSGQWNDCFTASKNTVTAHVYGKTDKEIAALRNSTVWCDFKQIVNHKTSVSYTLVNNGGATVSFLGVSGTSYENCSGTTQYAQILSGSKTGTVRAESYYAVEIKGVDFSTKDVTLKRNGVTKTLTQADDGQGTDVLYYDEQELNEDVNYEVTVKDKLCTLTLEQTGGYTGRITYTKTSNGTTSSGVTYTNPATIVGPQGGALKLSIPYDQYTPSTLTVNGRSYTLNKADGLATATVYLPAASTTAGTLTWQAPQVTYTHHQPQIMIMRSGEGDILFKGLCLPEEQAAEAYEQQFGYPADEYGIVVSAAADCQNTVTTVTVPDYDFLGRGEGYTFDATEWGMRAEITPVAGQTLKTLLVGWLTEDEDGRQMIEWEDILHGAFSNYVQYDESTNTYTFGWGFDEMNVWIGDYIINIAMGPEESAVETGKTLNFVRKGGRGISHIEWYDEVGRDFSFGEGSSSRTIPNGELQDNDLKMYIDTEEGETFHVYKNGADITGQFQLNGQSTTQYWAELEEESATYTLLIEESPDANPTWTIQNTTGNDVKVVTKYKNNTTGEETYSGTLNKVTFDDSKINMVTLEVYAENIDESKPVRILKNGVDVSYQFTVIDPKGDHLFLCYEVPVDVLMNCSWEISYNTDHKQTYIVRGGSRDPIFEVDHEILYNGPIHSVNQNEVPTSIYFAPFDNEYNSYIYTTVYVNDGETAKILRNGADITNLFTIKTTNRERYYELEINDADFNGDNTLSAFGFDIREAAVWEITIEEAHKMLNAYANNDVIVSVAKLVEGEEPTFSGQANAMHRWINEGETYVVKFEPQHGEELTRFDIGWTPIDIEQDSRLVRNDDGSYSFTISYGDMDESFDIMAVFGGERNIFVKTNGCAYTDVYVDGNLVAGFKNDTKTFVVSPGTTFQIKPFVDNDMVKKVMLNGTDVTNDVNYLRQKEETQGTGKFWQYDFSSVQGSAFIDIIYEKAQFDVNRDGSISIADVTTLVNKILGKE